MRLEPARFTFGPRRRFLNSAVTNNHYMTDDNGDSGSDSDSNSTDTVTSVDRKARVANTPDEDPRGSSNGSESGGDE